MQAVGSAHNSACKAGAAIRCVYMVILFAIIESLLLSCRPYEIYFTHVLLTAQSAARPLMITLKKSLNSAQAVNHRGV